MTISSNANASNADSSRSNESDYIVYLMRQFSLSIGSGRERKSVQRPPDTSAEAMTALTDPSGATSTSSAHRAAHASTTTPKIITKIRSNDKSRAIPAVPIAPVNEYTLECPHCSSNKSIALEDGNYVCNACDTVVSRFLDHSAEWRYYGADDSSKSYDPARCGPPVNDLIPCMGSILTPTGSARGSLGSKMIRKYQAWNTLTYRERTLYAVFDTLNSVAAKHGVSPIILEEAKNMYKRVSDNRIFRGDNKMAVIAACLYVSFVTNQVPRSYKEIADMFDVKLTCMTYACKLVQDILDLPVRPSTPLDFVNRFCNNLGMDDAFREACRRIVTSASDRDLLAEYTPPSAVAGCITLCASVKGVTLQKSKVAEVCQVSSVTVSKCYKAISAHREQILSSARV
jgi:transcription initiation factor TFIIB